MKFASTQALLVLAALGACSYVACSSTSEDGEGKEESGGNDTGGGGGESGGGGGSGKGNQGGAEDAGGEAGGGSAGTGGGAQGDAPYLDRATDSSKWGPGFTVTVPSGVAIQPGGTQYLTSPKLGAKPLPVHSGISRTVSLLKGSTADKRNTVKILFYGQSITRQEWYVSVTDELKKMYPNADIQTWMLASGGQPAAKMRRASEHDVIPLYPDLIIYQNYGDYSDVNAIVADWRSRTTAEVIIQNWHLGNDAGNAGVERMSYLFIPDVARRLGAEFLDSRTAFKNYVREKNLPNAGLTSDGIHLNGEGIALMSKIHVDMFKNHPADTVVDPLAMVNTFEVGKDVDWSGGTLAFEFTGNRIDLIAKSGAAIPAEAATIKVDGKKPSEFPGNYAFTRPNGGTQNIDKPEPGWPWKPGAPMRIDSQAPRVVEDWTLKIMNRSGMNFSFTVEGSVTGADGMGNNTSKFVSNSKRVVIDSADWFTKDPNDNWNVADNQVTWKSIALSTDVYPPKAIAPSSGKTEVATTLFQAVPNARHKVEITSKDGKPLAVAAVRTFRPPLMP